MLVELKDVLSRLGATVLREVSHPGVMAVFRLAIMEAQRAPEVAATLETARQLMRTAVQDILVQAQLMVSILLRIREDGN